MTCIDCCYALLKDSNIICTYEEGNCIITDRIKRLEKENSELRVNLHKAKEFLKWALHSDPEHDDLVDFDTKYNECEQFLKEEQDD